MIAHTSHRSASSTALRNASATLTRVSQSLDRMERRSADTRRQRSLELAEAAGLGPFSVVFRSLEVGRDGQPTVVEVDAPSASTLFLAHHVTVDLRAASATCDCLAASFGRPCKHAGAALLYGREVVKAYREAEREYFAGVRHEQNDAALRPSL